MRGIDWKRIAEMEREIHKNAVEHGFWEGNRSLEETMVLIHSEWSEALEEFREGRPFVWYGCAKKNIDSCEKSSEHDTKICRARETGCPYRMDKPEGVAVELIDGCIRILDYFGHMGLKLETIEGEEERFERICINDWSTVSLISFLHEMTTYSYTGLRDGSDEKNIAMIDLGIIIWAVFEWLTENGENPFEIMEEKHRYNKTRPWKHGKRI